MNLNAPILTPALGLIMSALPAPAADSLMPLSTATRVVQMCTANIFKLWSVLALGLALVATPLRAQFVYVASSSPVVFGNNVSAYSIGSNGALIPVPGSPFAAGSIPFSVAVDTTGSFAYVANYFNDNTLSAYRIGSNGALTPVPGSPFAAKGGPFSVVVDPIGKFVYVANFGGNNVSGYSIGPNGALTPVPGSPFAVGDGPVSVAVDPTGEFVYAANFYDFNVSAYRIGSNGGLTPVPGSPFAAGNARSVTVDPTGEFVYVANVGGDNVSAYSIGSNGALTPIPGSPFAAGNFPVSVAVDPTGKFVYVANDGGQNVSGYSIVSNGALTPVPGSPFAAGSAPDSVAVDPTGKFVYVANRGDATVSTYSIGSNGALTPVPGSPFATGAEPGEEELSVAITPLLPFATSFAKLQISAGGFDLNESFTLGANSNGINPITENVTLQIGTFSVTIPAGSFRQNPNGRFAFQGLINGVSLQAQIVPLGNNIFTFKAEGTGLNFTGLSNPVTVVLTVGIDSGSTAVNRNPNK